MSVEILKTLVTCVSSERHTHRFSRNGNRGGNTGRCRGVMFMDVEHANAGARRLDLGTATGTWGFDLVASSARAEL
jgi:hypothetical protein